MESKEGRAAKRRRLTEDWGKYYPQPLAELIAVVVQPFDDDDAALQDSTVKAHKEARGMVRQLFSGDGTRPSGGQIEAPLRDIAQMLAERLRLDQAALLAAARLSSALEFLGGAIPLRPAPVVDELVVPAAVKRLDKTVPFAMWR